jgi:hypothetical protein
MQEHEQARPAEVVIDYRSFLTWIGTAVVVYLILSGLATNLLPFSVFVQYSIIVHTVVGLIAVVPLVAIEYYHWKRRRGDATIGIARTALIAMAVLVLCLLTGLVITGMALFGIRVAELASTIHLVSAILLGVLIVAHLAPIVRRYGKTAPSPRRAPRKRFVFTGLGIIASLFLITGLLAGAQPEQQPFQAFPADYDLPHGDDRPFWPSRAAIADPPWLTDFLANVAVELGPEHGEAFADSLGGPETSGLRERTAELVESMALDADAIARVTTLVEAAISNKKETGSLKPASLAGSSSCGSSGCHEAIYEEWRASAHGFAAEDELFLRVQELLIESKGVAESRACAGCHDPAALLGGVRHGPWTAGRELQIFEGNSCVTCHSTVETDTNGNGGYVIRSPQRYLFEDYDSGVTSILGKFLIRTYPDQHVAEYKRPLYKTSEFCAACHKQVPPPGEATSAGLAQEQNEYDSWKNGRWYHGDDDPKTVECRECHMPLVDGETASIAVTACLPAICTSRQRWSCRVTTSRSHRRLPGCGVKSTFPRLPTSG